MRSKILFIDQDNGLVEKLNSKADVDIISNSEIEDRLIKNKVETENGYSVNYTLPFSEEFEKYDMIFVNYKNNRGLILALELKTDKNKVYVMSFNTLYLSNLIEEGELDGYVHKNGHTEERITDLIE